MPVVDEWRDWNTCAFKLIIPLALVPLFIGGWIAEDLELGSNRL